MGKEKKGNRISLWAFLISIPVAIAAISGGYVGIVKFLESRGPYLRAVVDCEQWKNPCDVEEELKGMVKVSNLCKSLKKVLEVMDPTIMVDELQDVCDLSCDIIIEVNEVAPCEADNVELLESMHTIEMRNDGGDLIENLGIIFENAKYIEYQKEGEERRRIRGQKQKLIPLEDLSPDATILMNVWATCKVSTQPKFKIRLKRGVKDIYIRTPVGTVAGLVNKYRKTSYGLMLLPFVGLILTACYNLIIRKRMRKAAWERAALQNKRKTTT